MNLLLNYAERNWSRTKKFQDQLDLHRIWKLVMKNEYSDSKFEEIPWYKQPTDYQKGEFCQKDFITQIQQNFYRLREIDMAIPTSFQQYEKKVHKEYLATCETESWADEFLGSKGDPDKDSLFEDVDSKRLKEIQQLQPNDDVILLHNIEKERSRHIGELIKKEIGWIPIIGPSTIKTAGKGLFLSGKCQKGTVLGIYPGMIYPESRKIYNNDKNQHLSELLNSFVVNGDLAHDLYFSNGYNRKVKWMEEKADRFKKFLEGDDYYIVNEPYLAQRFVHPYANLQYVNHPPRGLLDNVLCFEMRIPLNFDRKLLPYVPNQYYSRPTIETKSFGLIRIQVYVARRDLNNEEIFLNYRLNPHGELPKWYHPITPEEDKKLAMRY